MRTNIKEQTAFRFDSELVFRMKKAAKLKKLSLNQYVTDLITRDLEENNILPTAVLSDIQTSIASLYAGKMSIPDADSLSSDERLEHIWSR